jgi:peptide-methionine (S)-S-oxide reductase
LEEATFGAGCFWGVQTTFDKFKGVISTKVGYMGGNLKNPTYEDVCTKKTGHIEVVKIIFNPDIVSYDDLLNIFWKIHDPTTLNRQGSDVGTQYKSVIFYYNDDQRLIAEKSKNRAEKSHRFNGKIVTVIRPAGIFYPAEDYHQNYFKKKGLFG